MMYLRIFSLHFGRCHRQWQCMLDFFVYLDVDEQLAIDSDSVLWNMFFCFVSENANKEYDYDSMSLMILIHCKYSEHDFFFCLFQNYYITIYLFFSEFFYLFPCSPLAVKDCQNVDFWRCGGIQWSIQVCLGVDKMRVKSWPSHLQDKITYRILLPNDDGASEYFLLDSETGEISVRKVLTQTAPKNIYQVWLIDSDLSVL